MLSMALEDVCKKSCGGWMDDRMSLLDAAVQDIFTLMLGTPGLPEKDPGGVIAECAGWPGSALEHVAAVVGFVGAMQGACVLRVGEEGARRMTGCMLGTEAEQMESVVADAVGEVCNMVAGGWKSHVPELAGGCLLSVPTVISGRQHRIHGTSQSQRYDRMYWFDGQPVHFTLVCETLLCEPMG